MVRAILSAAAALDIYASRHLRPRKVLAALYGVSDKTVRDVWTGRTWGAVTGARNPRPLGRPRRRAFSFTFLPRLPALSPSRHKTRPRSRFPDMHDLSHSPYIF